MSINNPIIDSGPTSGRRVNYQLYIEQVSAVPPESFRVRGDNGVFDTVDQTPQRLGQFVHYRDPYAKWWDKTTTMYVVVEVNGVLEWKRVVHEAVFIDTVTGDPWDPLVGLPGY